MSKRDDFNQLVENFYKRNRINKNNDEKYMRGFRLKLGKFISQEQLKEHPKIQNIIVDCINKDYKYYSEELIKDFFIKFHIQLDEQLIKRRQELEKAVYFLNVLNKDTYKSNSSDDMVNLYIKVNDLPNEYFKQLSTVMDIEVKFERHLAGSKEYEYYTEEIYRKEREAQIALWTKRLKNKKILVLIDDYSGSGSTIDDFISKIKDYIPNNIKKIFVVCVHITEGAKVRIKKSLEKNCFEGQVVYYECSSKYFENKPQDELLIEKFERDIVKPSREKDILGFASTESVVTTYRNTPNNTLSLFWSDNPNEIAWKPLFPRDHKDGKLHTGYSKWVTEKHKLKWFIKINQVPDEKKDKAIVLIYVLNNGKQHALVTEIELSKIICYTSDIEIQECLDEQLIEKTTDNHYKISNFGSTFLEDLGLENSNWKQIDLEFNKKGEQKEEEFYFKF